MACGCGKSGGAAERRAIREASRAEAHAKLAETRALRTERIDAIRGRRQQQGQ